MLRCESLARENKRDAALLEKFMGGTHVCYMGCGVVVTRKKQSGGCVGKERSDSHFRKIPGPGSKMKAKTWDATQLFIAKKCKAAQFCTFPRSECSATETSWAPVYCKKECPEATPLVFHYSTVNFLPIHPPSINGHLHFFFHSLAFLSIHPFLHTIPQTTMTTCTTTCTIQMRNRSGL